MPWYSPISFTQLILDVLTFGIYGALKTQRRIESQSHKILSA